MVTGRVAIGGLEHATSWGPSTCPTCGLAFDLVAPEHDATYAHVALGWLCPDIDAPPLSDEPRHDVR